MKLMGMFFAWSILSVSLVAEPGLDTALAARPVQGHWLVEDASLLIEITECEPGSPTLCGFIRALPGQEQSPELIEYADQLCGLAILSDLTYNVDTNRWDQGEIFDPEAEQVYDAYIRIDRARLMVRAYEDLELAGESFYWTSSSPNNMGCEPQHLGGGK